MLLLFSSPSAPSHLFTLSPSPSPLLTTLTICLNHLFTSALSRSMLLPALLPPHHSISYLPLLVENNFNGMKNSELRKHLGWGCRHKKSVCVYVCECISVWMYVWVCVTLCVCENVCDYAVPFFHSCLAGGRDESVCVVFSQENKWMSCSFHCLPVCDMAAVWCGRYWCVCVCSLKWMKVSV